MRTGTADLQLHGGRAPAWVTEVRAGHSQKSAALRRLAGVERSLRAVS